MTLYGIFCNLDHIAVGEGKGRSTLYLKPWDMKSVKEPFFTELLGDGTRESPYVPGCGSANESPYCTIVTMWYLICLNQLALPCFICVNNWTLEVTKSGVKAEDGTFTSFTR